jgi:type VI secretion system secreted protein Hcp
MAIEKSRSGFASLVGRPLLAGAVATGAVAPADAVAEIFLKLQGVDGESTDDKHKGEIEILSYSQAFKSTLAAPGGGGGGTGKASCGAVTVVKEIDRSSPVLISSVVAGKHIGKATITFRTVGGDNPLEYYTVVLNDVVVTEIEQQDAADPGRIMERVVLAPSKFEFSYRPVNAKGGLGAAVTAGWDCVANKKI